MMIVCSKCETEYDLGFAPPSKPDDYPACPECGYNEGKAAALRRMKIKCLSLENWHLFAEEETGPFECMSDLSCAQPVFNRDGQYYCRESKRCWFEIDGRAFRYKNPDMFLYLLELLNHRRLRQVEHEAIGILITQRICPKALQDLYEREEQLRDLRKIRIETLTGRTS